MQLHLTAGTVEVTVHHCEGTLLTDVVFNVSAFNCTSCTVVWTGHRVILALWPVVGYDIFKGGLILLAVVTTEWPLATIFVLMLSDRTTLGAFPTIMSTLQCNKLTANMSLFRIGIQIQVLLELSQLSLPLTTGITMVGTMYLQLLQRPFKSLVGKSTKCHLITGGAFLI